MNRKNYQKIILAALFALCFLIPAFSRGRAEKVKEADWENVKNGATVRVSGRIRRVGNEPMTSLVITDADDKDWYLDEEGEKLLRMGEQRTVHVKAVVELKEMVLANGKRLNAKRILTGVAVLDQKQ